MDLSDNELCGTLPSWLSDDPTYTLSIQTNALQCPFPNYCNTNANVNCGTCEDEPCFPPNDICANNVVLTLATPTDGNNVRARQFQDGCTPLALDVFYSYNNGATDDNLNLEISTCGSTIDTYLSVHPNCNSLGTCYASNEDDFVCSTASRVVLDLSTNSNFIIAVASSAGEEGDFIITANTVNTPAVDSNGADNCADAMNNPSLVTNVANTFNNMNSALTLGGCGPVIGTQSYTVLFSYTTTIDYSRVVVDTCGSTFDNILKVFSGTCNQLDQAHCIAFNDDSAECGDTSSYLTFVGDVAGTTYYIAVSGKDDAYGDFDITVSEEIRSDCDSTDNGNFQLANKVPVVGSTTQVPPADMICSANGDTATPAKYYTYVTELEMGDIEISTCNSGSPVIFNIFTGDCDTLTCVGGDDGSSGVCSSAYYRFPLSSRLAQGTTIFIAVQSSTPMATVSSFTITVTETTAFTPTNVDCANAIEVQNNLPIQFNTQDSPTLGSSLTTCNDIGGSALVAFADAPVIYYNYTTAFNYGDLKIDTCLNAMFDSSIAIYTGDDCGSLTCVGSDDGSSTCGLGASYTIPSEDRFLADTFIVIAVYGNNENGGLGTLRVTEVGSATPLNFECSASVTLPVQGVLSDTTGSPTLQSDLPTCGSNPDTPVTWYSYTATANGMSSSTINACGSTISANPLEPFVQVFSGTCDTLSCVSSSTPSGNGECASVSFDSTGGTTYYVAVSSSDINNPTGAFFLASNEEGGCSVEGPEYNCPTSFTVTTTTTCGGVQCGQIPTPIPLGDCFDECECIESQVSGPDAGDILPAGIYEVETVGVNANTVLTDLCKYRITIKDKCKANGPSIVCPNENPIYLQTRSSCTISGQSCAVYPGIFLGSCSDNAGCKCEVMQTNTEEITVGQRLLPGTYTVRSQAVSEFTTGESCEFTVIVEE